MKTSPKNSSPGSLVNSVTITSLITSVDQTPTNAAVSLGALKVKLPLVFPSGSFKVTKNRESIKGAPLSGPGTKPVSNSGSTKLKPKENQVGLGKHPILVIHWPKETKSMSSLPRRPV